MKTVFYLIIFLSPWLLHLHPFQVQQPPWLIIWEQADVIYLSPVAYCDVTDNLPVFQITSSQNKTTPSEEKIIFIEELIQNVLLLQNDLRNSNWDDILLLEDPNEAYGLF